MISEEFEMSMIGELTMFLGFQIKQMKDGIFILQEKYVHDLLKRFGMENCKEIKTPMASNGQIEPELQGKPVDQKLYRSMIGSLLYLTASWPDIMFSVCMCARYQANPKESHEKFAKRIPRYLRYTPGFGLWYPKSAHFKLLGYSDSDFAGCKIDRKSTMGDVNYLGDLWYLGVLRKKIPLLSQLLKPNILQPKLVVLKFSI